MEDKDEILNQIIADEGEERMKKNSEKENYDGEELTLEEMLRIEKESEMMDFLYSDLADIDPAAEDAREKEEFEEKYGYTDDYDYEDDERERLKKLGYTDAEIEAEIAEMMKEPEPVYSELTEKPKKLKLCLFGDDEEWKE